MRRPVALVLALMVGGPIAALAAEQAGVSAAVRGSVEVARAPATARAVRSGEEIFMQDALRSGARSGMQILLLDETVFTIGPDSALVVDEFVYDPSTDAGRVQATVAKGVFRFVTGKIAKKRPSDMKVSLPSGQIGVRGTIVAGSADDATRTSLVILLGDGAAGASQSAAPSIEVCNAGTCETIVSVGFGVRILGPDAPPTEPFRVPSEQIEAILAALANPEQVEQGPTGPLDLPKLASPEDEERVREARRRLGVLDALGGLSDAAAQDARGPGEVRPPSPPPTTPERVQTPPPSASPSHSVGPSSGP